MIEPRTPPPKNLTFTSRKGTNTCGQATFSSTRMHNTSSKQRRWHQACESQIMRRHSSRSRPATSPSAGALSPTFSPLCLVGSLSLLFLPGILHRHHAPIPAVWESHVTSAGQQCTLSSVCSQPFRATTHLMHTGPAPRRREGSPCQPQAVALCPKLGDCWFHQDRFVAISGRPHKNVG